MIVENIIKVEVDVKSSSLFVEALKKAINYYNKNTDGTLIPKDLENLKIFKSKSNGLPNLDNESNFLVIKLFR